MYECLLSDHHPIVGTIEPNFVIQSTVNNDNELKRRVSWDKLSPSMLRLYTRRTDVGFSNLSIPDGLKS